MFTVLHDGREFAINHIQSAKITNPISDIPELALTTINKSNNAGYQYIVGNAILNINGHEWRVKPITARTHYKNVKAVHIAFDLVDMPFNQSLTGTYTPDELFPIILNGTGFTIQLDATGIDSINVESFGRTSVWSAFEDAVKAFGLEFRFLPGRIIQLAKELSVDNGKQFRYGYNVKSLAEKTDPTDIVTHVIVNYGEDYERTATFTSPTAANYARPVYKIINDSRIETVDTARERAAKEFRDLELAYEIDCMQTNEVYELGEVVYTTYEPLNDLSIGTRVLKTTYDWDGASQEFLLTSVTVGNYIFKSEGDIIQELVSSTKSESDKKIEEARKSIKIEFIEELEDPNGIVTGKIEASAEALETEFTRQVEDVDGKLTTFKEEEFTTFKQDAEGFQAEANRKIEENKSAIEDITGEIEDVNERVDDLKNFTDSAFADGIVTRAEKESLKSHIQQLNNEKSDVDNRYAALNGNTSLSGTPKTNLANAKTAYDTAHANLISSINTAIADATITPTERTDVENKFTAYRTALATLSSRFEAAVRAIEDAKDGVVNGRVTTLSNEYYAFKATAEGVHSEVGAMQTTVDDNNTWITSNASYVSQLPNEISQKVSTTDYNGNTIATLINQTATTVAIKAEKINLIGATIVNGDFTGTGSINVSTNAYIGNNLYLGQNGSGTKTIQFNGGVSIQGDSSYVMNISAMRTDITDGNVMIGDGAYSVYCGGYWDFSNARVSGLTANHAATAGSAATANYATTAGSATTANHAATATSANSATKADRVGLFSFAYLTTGKLTVYRDGTKIGDVTLT